MPETGADVLETLSLPGDGLRVAASRWAPAGAELLGTVLLLHGGGQTRHSWRRTGERLAGAGWAAVALDARGHGESDWDPAARYGLDAMVADLVAVTRELAVRPVLVGASMGGLTSLVAAGEHPALVRGLVLVDAAPRPETSGVREIVTFMQSGQDGFASLQEAAEAVAAYTPERRRPSNPDGLRKNLRQRDGRWYWHWDPAMFMARPQPDDATLADAPPGAPGTYERLLEAARAVAVPTLVVRGQQSRVVSPESAAELLALIPHAEGLVVASAAHMIAGDDNDAFAGGLIDWLDRAVQSDGRPRSATDLPPV